MNEIETLTKNFSDARKTLSDRVQGYEDEKQVVLRTHLRGIKQAVKVAAEKQSLLKAALEESPELFTKPRSVIFHGVKIGYQKGKGEIVIENPEQTIKLIKRNFPDEWTLYIEVKEKPMPSTLKNLSVADLKKIGVTVIETGDQIVIKTTDSEIDKLVNALLKDEEMEA
jgi:hypothetical protein